MVEITITAWARTLLRQAQCAHYLGLLPSLDSPAMKLALTAEGALQNTAVQQAQSELDIARAFRRTCSSQ
ncbi:MAG: hypothetical protein JWP51_1028 [Bradyrhizobium sp.]|jgi:hypothetical protein|nr:hypothetical protein [Bradyrhizobium sp.]